MPILTATLLSFVVFAVPPSKLDTRLQTAIGLFLSLVAVQFVIEGDLPKSSYVIPVSFVFFRSFFVVWGGEGGRETERDQKKKEKKGYQTNPRFCCHFFNSPLPPFFLLFISRAPFSLFLLPAI